MSHLSGKRVLLGVTGGIAAYKSASLIRILREAGADVRVVMTASSRAFIGPLTLQAVSGHPVHEELMDPAQEAAMGHIQLARWADLVLVAPATANFMARLAQGLADDLLSTLCLATRAPIALAPAMNREMWLNPVTQKNRALLESRGMLLWGPGEGAQACGEIGPGRLLEPEQLAQRVDDRFAPGDLQGISVLLTAGPTREPLDPVRFMGNRSSGKMGYALAAALAEAGAKVCLVSGPVSLECPAGVSRILVETAVEMYDAVMARVTDCALFVAAAAVADYRPAQVTRQKLKKQEHNLEISLVPNPDILAEVAALPHPPFTVGFAAETERLEEYAEIKRRTKGIDMIAANLVDAPEGGFERDENALTLLWEGGKERFPLASKSLLARQLAARIAEHFHAKTTAEDS